MIRSIGEGWIGGGWIGDAVRDVVTADLPVTVEVDPRGFSLAVRGNALLSVAGGAAVLAAEERITGLAAPGDATAVTVAPTATLVGDEASERVTVDG